MNRSLVLVTAAVVAQVGIGVQQPPPLRSSVDVIAVDVHVVDRDGRPVTGLRTDEFVVSVDGRRRTVQSADFVSYASTAATPSPVGPPRPLLSYSSNLAPTSRTTPPRTIMLVVDQENIRADRAHWAVQAAAGFLDRARPDDLMGVMTMPDAGVDPTTDRAAVRKALGRVMGHLARPEDTFGVQRHRLGLAEAFAFFGDQRLWRAVLARECTDPSDPSCQEEMASHARVMTAEAQRRAAGTSRSLRPC